MDVYNVRLGWIVAWNAPRWRLDDTLAFSLWGLFASSDSEEPKRLYIGDPEVAKRTNR